MKRATLGAAVAGLLMVPTVAIGAPAAFAGESDQVTSTATKPKRVFVVSHRGDVKSAPETTLDAFAKAISKGVDGIEFDVRYTQDGIPVALHDDTVDRTTNCEGLVRELTYAVLQQCEVTDVLSQLTLSNRVPTVFECLDFIAKQSKTVKAFLHQKTIITDAQAAALVEMAKATKMDKRNVYVVEQTSQYNILRKAAVPKDQLGLMVNTAKDYTRPYKWLVPYRVDVTWDVALPAVDKGKYVLPVENEPAEIATAVAAGANGIYLNHLDEGLAYLRERGLH